MALFHSQTRRHMINSNTLHTYITLEANTMNADQTVLIWVHIGYNLGYQNLILLLHLSEYLMNGLTNAICHQFAMIAV